MGNATRCDALADLLPAGYLVDFISSDKALDYLKAAGRNTFAQKNINSGKPEKFGSPLFFLKYLPRFFTRIYSNFLIQRKLIAQNNYDYVVFDSDYSFILHRIFKTKTPLVGLNNSYEVVNFYLKNPLSLRPALVPSLLVETLDFCVYSLFCRYVLCPSVKPEALNRLFGKFLISPLLIRSKLMTEPQPQKKFGVMVMASSSGAKSPLSALPAPPFSTSNFQQLLETRAVICNAGQSSISECLYLDKTALVIPIPKHAEQFANAALAAEKGLQRSDVLKEIEFKFAPNARYHYDFVHTCAVVKSHLHTIEEAL
jgi:hypothetical protein